MSEEPKKHEEQRLESFFSKITEEIESLKSMVLNSSIVQANSHSKEDMAESVLSMIGDLKQAMKSAFAN